MLTIDYVKYRFLQGISFGDWLAEPQYSADYDATEKIIIRQTGDSLVSALDDHQFVARDNLYTIVSGHEDTDLKYVLGIMTLAYLIGTTRIFSIPKKARH